MLNINLYNIDFTCAPLITEGFDGNELLAYMCSRNTEGFAPTKKPAQANRRFRPARSVARTPPPPKNIFPPARAPPRRVSNNRPRTPRPTK